jgi:hypothetical protein
VLAPKIVVPVPPGATVPHAGPGYPVTGTDLQEDSLLDRLRSLFNRPPTAEDDVEPDTHVARTRETGGAPGDDGDRATTTGTGPSGEFVGRAGGQDVGYAGETGAERRAES